MTKKEQLILAEEITHEIMTQFQDEVYGHDDSTFTTGFTEFLENQLRPIILKGADNWLNKRTC